MVRRVLVVAATVFAVALSAAPVVASPTPSPSPGPQLGDTGAFDPVPDLDRPPSPSPLPSPREPGPEVTIPADPRPPTRTGANRCERGQYGDVLPDGTVDAGCDGVLGFAEQRFPDTVRVAVEVVVGEAVAVTLDERDVRGRIVRVDAVSTRGGAVRRYPLLYTAPAGLEGRDGFSLWAFGSDEYEREVRVVVDVVRTTGAGAAAPPRGVQVRASEAAVAATNIAAFEEATEGWLGPVLTLLLGLGLVLVAWGAARRRGWTLRLPERPVDAPEGPTGVTQFVSGD